MRSIFRFPQSVVRFSFTAIFALLLGGCVTCVDCDKKCGPPGLPGDPPVSCPSLAIDVTAGDGTNCLVNPGVSKKCKQLGVHCPMAYNTTECKTVGAPGTNCSCQCSP
jgi:hypothetical protein